MASQLHKGQQLRDLCAAWSRQALASLLPVAHVVRTTSDDGQDVLHNEIGDGT